MPTEWRESKRLRHGLVLVAVAAMSLGAFSVRDRLELLAAAGYMGVFLASLIGSATVIFPMSSTPIVLAAGGVLDPILVGVLAGIGAGLGECVAYSSGRAGRELVADSPKLRSTRGHVSNWGSAFIFAGAAVPNPAFDLVGIAAGAVGFPWNRFLLAAGAGKTLQFIVIALIGSGLDWPWQG